MGLIKVGTKGLSKGGKTGKLVKNNQVVPANKKVHVQGVVQTGKRTVGFSVQSKPGKRAEISFGYMNRGFGEHRATDGITGSLPLPTGKELAVAGGLVGTAYALGYTNESVYKKKSGKRTK